MPSPSQSVGCEPHGDHWHCDGPAETGSAGGEEGAAGAIGVDLSAVAAMAIGVAAVLA